MILDEIGRGTSTYDGLSIAWSVAEHLHDRIGALTLFATHYHELTEMAETHAAARNFTVAVREWNDEIVFLHRIVPGAADRSYGIQVARLAGLPGGDHRPGEGDSRAAGGGRLEGGGVQHADRREAAANRARESEEVMPSFGWFGEAEKKDAGKR